MKQRHKRPSVSVVIPTYNGKHLLKHSFPQVLEQLAYGDQVIVIEDGGDDGSIDWLDTTYSSSLKKKGITLDLIYNKKNLRFAASCNKAVKNVSHEYLWLLNNDVSPHTGCLTALFDCLENQTDPEKIFAIGCKEFETHINQIGGKNKLWFERGMFIHSRADSFETGETAWVSGGSGIFKKKIWTELGGFDTLFYPAYWEDVDLSFRARQAGYTILFCETAEVDHNHESTNTAVFGSRELELAALINSLRFLKKHATIKQWLKHFLWSPYLILAWVRSYGIESIAVYYTTLLEQDE